MVLQDSVENPHHHKAHGEHTPAPSTQVPGEISERVFCDFSSRGEQVFPVLRQDFGPTAQAAKVERETGVLLPETAYHFIVNARQLQPPITECRIIYERLWRYLALRDFT